jgi:PAS domain S-box-containing protein
MDALTGPVFRAAFERSRDGMLVFDDTGRYIDANPAACELLGRSRDEILDVTFHVLSVEPAETITARWNAFLEHGAADGEWQLQRADGEVRIMQYTSIANIAPGQHFAILRDVTDMRRAQSEVRRSGDMFAKAFHATPMVLAVSTVPGQQIIDINEAGLKLIGRTRDEVVGKTGIELGLWGDLADRQRLSDEWQRTGRVREFPARMRNKSGDPLDVLVSVDIIEVHGQKVALTHIVNLTPQLTAERKLDESLERHRRIVEASPLGVVTLGPDGRITFANRWIADLVGTTPSAMLGCQGVDFIVPEERRTIVERRARILHGMTQTFDMTVLRVDGAQRIVEVTASSLTSSPTEAQATLAVMTDVTERRQAEELRARLAAIVESSRDAITSCDRECRIQTWNPAAERLFGYTAQEMLGESFERVVPGDRTDAYREVFRRALAGDVVITETQRQHKSGALIDVSVTHSPVLDPAGRVVAVSTVTRDISTQKRLQASLREAEQRLNHIQKMEAIGALAGGIAHDFNNLLSVILTCSTMVEDSLTPGKPSTGEGLGTIVNEARAIREAAERAASLTRQLLAFSRREPVAPRVVNLGGVIAGIETMLKRLLGERVTLIVTPPDDGNAIIDPGQFEQVVLNLSVNARDAMPDGGRLTIDCENVTVDEAGCAGTAAQPGPFVRITVTDTGVGMDETTAQRMFEPGFTTKGRTGTGLGLATVYAVIHQSGGFVRVDTRRGRGTSVEVYVPRTDRPVEGDLATVAAPVAHRGGETILLVEDDELVRGRVEQVLRRDGYIVLVASNAGEAILLAEQEPKIDLMVTDVIMPIMDGRRLAERLRVHLSGLPVVYMSGYQNDDALRGMLASPNVSYLQKPVRPEILLSRVREALDRR